MARVVSVSAADDIRKSLARSLQSGHINFLIGSGASLPAIPAAGAVEREIAELLAHDESAGKRRMSGFLATVQEPTNRLIDGVADANNEQSLSQYREFLGAIESVLLRRRTTLLPRQVTIFSTNYDLLVEQASIAYAALTLNDGFGRVKSLENRMEFSTRNFFSTTYSTGNLYSYKAEVPSINLIKLHGSLSWRKHKDDIVFDIASKQTPAADATAAAIDEYIGGFSVVLPQAAKFRTTLMDRTYYDLLRIYANELDRENALLVVFGFSFGDEHIRDITRRALKNPTLRVVIAAFDETASTEFAASFAKFNNVEIIAPGAGGQLRFAEFNKVLRSILPTVGAGA